jgi:hypothetical protein
MPGASSALAGRVRIRRSWANSSMVVLRSAQNMRDRLEAPRSPDPVSDLALDPVADAAGGFASVCRLERERSPVVWLCLLC